MASKTFADAEEPAADVTSTGLGAAAKFNPQLLKPEELRAIFVARQAELAELIRRLEQATPSMSPQHVLITGQRGMGKSTLMHRLALAVEDRPDLREAWVPLLFREEQYTVVSLDKFWRNALDALSEALERRAAMQPETASEVQALDAINAALDDEPDLRKREQRALAALTDWADRHKTRLLLLVDSTELLFESLTQGKTAREPASSRARENQPLWRLRECLSNNTQLFWMSCAYIALEAHHGYEHPFHEFFAQLALKPLNADDMRLAFMALARTFGTGRGMTLEAAEVHAQELLTRQPERLEALLRLAGGNPRTTVLLYQLLAAGGHDNVHNDLKRMLDDMSPLYKDRLENQLAVQPRQLVATLMEHWAPMSANALAKATSLTVQQVNAQLSRLEQTDWVEKTRLPGTRRAGYQVVERFFNVYYLMRLAPRRLRLRLTWLVEFMRIWFSEGERNQLASRRMNLHGDGLACDGLQMEFSRAVALSLDARAPARAQLELALYGQTIRGRVGELMLFEPDGEDRQFASIDEYKAEFLKLRPLLIAPSPSVSASDSERQAFANQVLGSIGLSLTEKVRVADWASKMSQFQFDNVRKVLSEEPIKWALYLTDAADFELISQRVQSGDFFPDAPSVELGLTQARAWFSSRPACFGVALMLIFERHRNSAALLSNEIKYLMESDFPNSEIWGSLSSIYVLNGDFELTKKLILKAIKSKPRLAKNYVALAYIQQNYYSNFEEAKSALSKALELDPNSAFVWDALGDLLQFYLREISAAEEAYLTAISIDPAYASSWNNLGNLYWHEFRRFEDAENAYRKALSCPITKGKEQTRAVFFVNLAQLFVQVNRTKQAKDSYEDALKVLSQSKHKTDGANLRLQANLYLGNLEQARTALSDLTQFMLGLSKATKQSMFLIEEQARGCQQIGMGLALADLLSEDDSSVLLKPVELALRIINGQADALLSHPAEVQAIAREVAQRWKPELRQATD